MVDTETVTRDSRSLNNYIHTGRYTRGRCAVELRRARGRGGGARSAATGVLSGSVGPRVGTPVWMDGWMVGAEGAERAPLRFCIQKLFGMWSAASPDLMNGKPAPATWL